MERVRTTGSRVAPSRARIAAAAGSLTALMALAACTSGANSGGKSSGGAPSGSAAAPSGSGKPAESSSSTAEAAVITTNVASTGVSPAKPISVSIAHGKLTAVTMVNPTGHAVKGAMTADGKSWHTTEDLGYAKTYRMTAAGQGADGAVVTKRARFTTLQPDNQTAVFMNRTGDYPLANNGTYGVAILPEMRFDEAISSKAGRAAAEKAITVTTTPHVAGAWAWADDNRLYYRPKGYWPSGTKVTINANIYGVKLGKGLYGQGDKSVHFKVGRRQVTVADDNAPKSVNTVKIYNAAGKAIKTFHTSMGEHSGVTVNGNYINFYTLDGTYTVLEHDNPAYMSSDSYGLPSSSPQGYAREPIYWSTKISVDGIYLHELDTTIYAQEHGADVSHGCLNLSQAHAKWFYRHSMVGDPVVINGAKHAPKIQVWQGGGWSVPWSAWKTGDISRYN
jgi:lipoprotein-anchoring transpeptidase ErfK/SrfK